MYESIHGKYVETRTNMSGAPRAQSKTPETVTPTIPSSVMRGDPLSAKQIPGIKDKILEF